MPTSRNERGTIPGQDRIQQKKSADPHGLKAEAICLEARILTVADVFDALTAERPYRAAMPIARALQILDQDASSAFDPACIAALKSGLAKLNASAAA